MLRLLRIIILLLISTASAWSQTDTLPSLRMLLNRGNTVDSVVARPDSIYWRHTLEAGINLNQGSFSNNWTGGGVNSIALGLLVNGKLSYRRNRFNWGIRTQLQYGIVKNAQQALRKNTDRLFFDGKAGYRISTRWQWFGSLTLLSQFAPGFNYVTLPSGIEAANQISNFFAPAYLTESFGLTYEPSDGFDLRLGVLTLRQTFVTDTTVRQYIPENYGVPPDQTSRTEIAFQFVANYDQDFAQNLKVRYQFFADYRNLAAPDHRVDLTLTGKINKLFNANLSGVLLYDQDQDTRIQYSQALAVGLLLTL
ncbi:hypothetical protein BN8_03937 [Fibrisoma limi BUZ 3]|uniref:DUF3078 domain-containing protein n=1 Tax=Fibrisoma limi BUZ 3 TaxID=1185876 RepID=I2GLG0_9BACT|nr:DUF3078 domain-containing protein [Fibrisoma limi]CCH54736.1 hypothetical protein BN8_03937 [Fibrisoma limi BUZ 3]